MLSFTLTVADEAALRELYEKQLSQGRAFVAGASGVEAALAACELVIEHCGRTHTLAAEVVFVKEEDPGRGVGVTLAPMDGAAKDALRAFVEAGADTGTSADAGVSASDEEAIARNLQERVRGLSILEQQRMASSGALTERIVLERIYGPNVWETLLRNPRLTVPEVARIGRKGTLPRPLVEAIAANASWLAAGEVQRALLSNPRSSTAVIEKLLRGMTRSELNLVLQQTAYPITVRQAAKRVLGAMK